MNQQTRHNIANILVGVTILCIATFVVQHFMTSPRPYWHRDLPYLGIVLILTSHLVRGRRRWRATHDAE